MMESMDKGLTAPNAPKFLQLFLPIGIKVLDVVEKRLYRVSVVRVIVDTIAIKQSHCTTREKDSFSSKKTTMPN